MNRGILIYRVASGFLAWDTKKDSQLDTLVAKRDSLLIVVEELNIQISELDTLSVQWVALGTYDDLSIGKFEHFFEVQGIVEAKTNVMIVAEMPALFEKIHVTEGQYVKKGTLLVSLDNQTILNQIDELNTKLKLATFVFEKQSN